jgi:hypothetical protein
VEHFEDVTIGHLQDVKLRSPLLPGGDLVSAVLNRQVMVLADRGGASGLVGRRWADLCAEWAAGAVGTRSHAPDRVAEPFAIERIARLDDAPEIAAVASRRGLQNPDLVIVGSRDGRTILQAADAKFSVETARTKQVSPEVVAALLTLGPVVCSLTGELGPEVEFVPGLFLSPDFPLTHLMLKGRQGIMRATVRPSEVRLISVDPATFFTPLPSAPVMHVLSEVDDLPVSIGSSLLAGLYYFRLARAAVGAWLDSVRPLLFLNDQIAVDERAVLDEAIARATTEQSAFQLVLHWDMDVESIRARRAAVDRVTSLPVVTRELRAAIAAVMKDGEDEGPSVNQVRRRLGAWFRGELRTRFGPMPPDEPDFASRLMDLGKVGAEIAKGLPERTTLIVRTLVAERANQGSGEAEAAIPPDGEPPGPLE